MQNLNLTWGVESKEVKD